MKLKKITKILPGWETVRIWGWDEKRPLYTGPVEEIPYVLLNLKMTEGEDGSYMDVRYDCVDCENHVAVFVDDFNYGKEK